MNQLEASTTGTVRAEAIPAAEPAAFAHADTAPLDNLFSPTEWRELHSQDKLAGTTIVAIMIMIFSLGLIGYIAIALVCMGG